MNAVKTKQIFWGWVGFEPGESQSTANTLLLSPPCTMRN